MNAAMGGWLARVLATDAPALPVAPAMQLWLHGGWGLVLAGLGVVAVGRWWGATPSPARRRGGTALVFALALWAWLPGLYSPSYWLGLAFQMPSVVTVLLCGGLLWQRLARWGGAGHAPPGHDGGVSLAGLAMVRGTLALCVIGVLLGWALLLDAFALLPVQLYAWGFSPAALGLSLVLVCLPWVALGRAARAGRHMLWVAPLALLVFAIWRLPTGNVWDAVLDPWLWLLLHEPLARAAWRRHQARRGG